MCMPICVCLYVYAYMCMPICVCLYVYAYMCMPICVCLYVYAYMCMPICVCLYVYAYMCMSCGAFNCFDFLEACMPSALNIIISSSCCNGHTQNMCTTTHKLTPTHTNTQYMMICWSSHITFQSQQK